MTRYSNLTKVEFSGSWMVPSKLPAWDKLKGLDINKSFFIGGGISPEDPPLLKEFAKDPVAKDLFAVDINSKFEISPGVKDMAKIKQFIAELNG